MNTTIKIIAFVLCLIGLGCTSVDKSSKATADAQIERVSNDEDDADITVDDAFNATERLMLFFHSGKIEDGFIFDCTVKRKTNVASFVCTDGAPDKVVVRQYFKRTPASISQPFEVKEVADEPFAYDLDCRATIVTVAYTSNGGVIQQTFNRRQGKLVLVGCQMGELAFNKP